MTNADTVSLPLEGSGVNFMRIIYIVDLGNFTIEIPSNVGLVSQKLQIVQFATQESIIIQLLCVMCVRDDPNL